MTLWLNSKVFWKFRKFFEITSALKFIFNRTKRYQILYETAG